MNKFKQRQSNLYDPLRHSLTQVKQVAAKEPFRLSRSKIDLFLECPRCFYFDRKLGLGRPSMPSFALNSAVDHLLKNEFDILRLSGERHELIERYGIDAIPYNHPNLPLWRDDMYQFVGATVVHQPTNLEISGIIDDIWINTQEELLIVDYKSTSTSQEISLDDEYREGYKKQLEVYQWIFRQKGFKVNDIGYFVYANAGRNRPKFDARLEFELQIIEYQGDASWVEPTIFEIKKILESDNIPDPNTDCEFCQYRKLIRLQEP